MSYAAHGRELQHLRVWLSKRKGLHSIVYTCCRLVERRWSLFEKRRFSLIFWSCRRASGGEERGINRMCWEPGPRVELRIIGQTNAALSDEPEGFSGEGVKVRVR